MKKTLSINLNNQNFQIEEGAYEKLAAYLENIKKHCGAGADSSEVISDIENSMAEKLKLALTPYKEIITNDDIDSLIKIMGTVEDFDREIGGTNLDNLEKEEEPYGHKVQRKLYRDTDNAVIGGVAAGLGNYFNIDPVLFRIIFCALIFAGGSGFIIYFLLWIAMPEAKSAYQKLEMQGTPPTLAAFKNLSKTGKQLQDSWKKRWEKRSALGKIFTLPLVILNGLFLFCKKVWNALWPAVKLSFGLCLSVFSFIGLGFIGIGSLFLLLYNNSSYLIYFVPISEVTKLMPYTWMVILGFLSLAIPTAMILVGGIAIIRKKNIINFTIGSILIGSWMISGIIFCALCLRYAPEVQNKINKNPLTQQINQAIDLNGVTNIEASGKRVYILVSAATNTPSFLSGRQIDLDHVEIKREGNKLTLTEKDLAIDNAICLDCDWQSLDLTVATSSNLNIKVEHGSLVTYEEKEIPSEDVSDETTKE